MGQSSRMQDAGSLEVAIDCLLSMYFVLWEDPRNRSLRAALYVVCTWIFWNRDRLSVCWNGLCEPGLFPVGVGHEAWMGEGEANDHHIWTVQYTEYSVYTTAMAV